MVHAREQKSDSKSSQSKATIAQSHSNSPSQREIKDREMSKSTSNLLTKNISSEPTSRNTASPTVSRFSSVFMQDSQDPLEDYKQGDDIKSLLYGLSEYRNVTIDRLEENEINPEQPIIIDEYNAQIGLLEVLEQQPAISIFVIREALENPQNWRKIFSNASAGVTEEGNPLKLWVDKLVANKHSIGLYDLGDQTQGANKLESKDRLGKNDTTEGESTIITSENINNWLDSRNSFRRAMRISKDMPDEDYNALNNWIYREIIRRICKLGIDFGTQDLDSKIHFNKAGAIDPKNSASPNSKAIPDGLLLNSDIGDQSQDRAITTSEIRHAAKAITESKIPKEKINTYNEL